MIPQFHFISRCWRRLQSCLSATGLLCATILSAHAAVYTFNGTNTGVINDNDPVGRNVTFTVQPGDVTNSLRKVQVRMTLSHSQIGDLKATLFSPDNRARLVLFGRTGIKRNGVAGGDTTNTVGNYIFSDDSGNDWWATSAQNLSGTLPPGTYRTSTQGVVNTFHGGCTSWLEGAFAGLTPAQATGTWTLNIADLSASVNFGQQISEATLSLDDTMFSGNFEESVRGNCQKTQFDYTGSGRTSFVVINTGTDNNMYWRIKNNDGTLNGTTFLTPVFWGENSTNDMPVGGDFDGDGIWDPAVWRPTTGQFFVNRSSRPFTNLPTGDIPLIVQLGQLGDDPHHLGDYDGDNRTDFAVYRPGANANDTAHILARLSYSGGNLNVPLGDSSGLPAGGADYANADGKAEILIRRSNAMNQGVFTIYTPLTGTSVGPLTFGSTSDLLLHANFNASSPNYELNRVFYSGGFWNWATLFPATTIQFDDNLNAYPLVGDYDGDGLDDPAVWYVPNDITVNGFSDFFYKSSVDNLTYARQVSNQIVPGNMLGNVNFPIANTRVYSPF